MGRFGGQWGHLRRCSFPQRFVANTDALEEIFESAYYYVNAKKNKSA